MNQSKYNYIRSLGFSGALNDIVAAFYRSVGAVGGAIQDLERNMFDVMGIASGALQDRWEAYYDRVGYTGDKESAWGVAITDSKLLQEQAIGVIRRNNGTALYVPDDYRGAYIDSTGTQPVTAVGDLVGLLTDRSYGAGNLGGELVTNGGFDSDTAWTKHATTTISGGVASTSGLPAYASMVTQNISLVTGKSYRYSFNVTKVSGTNLTVSYGAFGISANVGTTGTFSGVFVAQTTGSVPFYLWEQTGGTWVGSVDNISVREVLGNHASQPTTASKPVVTRVPKRLGPNIAIPTTSTAGWGATSATLSSDGTTLTVTNTTTAEGYANSSPAFLGGKTYVVTLVVSSAISSGAITIAGTRSALSGTGFKQYTVSPANDYPGNGLRVSTNSVTAGHTIAFREVSVQEVLEWTPALKFDGSNDSLTLSSGAILQQGSDHWVTAAFVLDAVGSQQTVYEASSSSATNPVVCRVSVDPAGNIAGFWRDDAGVSNGASVAVGVTVGTPYVVTVARTSGQFRVWVNGVSGTPVAASVGTTTVNVANAGSSVRNGVAQFYLNGKLIDIALGQSTLTEADRKTIERNMAQRIGATYVG